MDDEIGLKDHKNMASTAFSKCKGVLLFLLLGLQSSAFVSGDVSTTVNTTVMSENMTLTTPLGLQTSAFVSGDVSTTVTTTVMSENMTLTTPLGLQTSAFVSGDVSTTVTTTVMSKNITLTTPPSTTSVSTMPSTSMSYTTLTGNATMNTTMNTTFWNGEIDMMFCLDFSCNDSNCNSVFMNATAFPCPDNVTFCQIKRMKDMTYMGGCIATCSNPCVNSTQVDCSMGCCNFTDCLNVTLASINPSGSMSVTTMETSSTTTTTTTKATMASMIQQATTLESSSSATREPHAPLPVITAALLACLLSFGSLV